MSSPNPFELAKQAVAAVEVGDGNEKFRYGRETMRADAISAIEAAEGPGWTDTALHAWHIANLEAFFDLSPADQKWIAIERPILMQRLNAATQKALKVTP